MPPSLESTLAAEVARRLEQTAKEDRYRQRRRRMTLNLAIAGGLGALLALLVLTLTWRFPVWHLSLTVAVATTAAAAIGWLNLGILTGHLVYGLPVGLLHLGTALIGIPIGSFASPIFLLVLLVWHVAWGGVLGWINQTFDQDHVQI